MDEIDIKTTLISSRLRCPDCNAGPDDFIFLFTEDVRLRYVLSNRFNYKLKIPAFIKNSQYKKKMGLNKAQMVENCKTLARVCCNCGNVRKMSINE